MYDRTSFLFSLFCRNIKTLLICNCAARPHPNINKTSQIAKFMGPSWGPPGSCRPHMGLMLVSWTLLSGVAKGHAPLEIQGMAVSKYKIVEVLGTLCLGLLQMRHEPCNVLPGIACPFKRRYCKYMRLQHDHYCPCRYPGAPFIKIALS